ncbi:SIR2 family protein, partial [Roseovarius sp.]|uniref:P-loop NTPase n=1 Tax=Roseovarius sp. TaxID=1486281 RepID=UPI0035692C92
MSGFLDIIRERAAEASDGHATALDEILGKATESQKYQAAMSWVYRTIGPGAVTDIVQGAVLKARQTSAPATDGSEADDRDPEHWRISRGQRGLARLMKVERERFRGPVFTTNFDPLIGLALQEQGLVPIVHPMASDGTLPNNQQAAPDQVDVFHLHGYWRNSATLHKPEQLLSKRPALQGSLEDRLNNTMLVVMAYSGWDDIFTEAIARCIQSPSFSGEILWCFHEDVPEVAEKWHADLMAKFDAGRRSGDISFYCGIDCHTFFDELLPAIEPEAPVRAAREGSPIPGWELVSCEYLDGLSDLTDADAIRFFDGAIPSWRHAQSPQIPRLSHAETLRARIANAFADTGASAMQLVRAAGGEGKSTAMLQAAVDIVRSGDAHVLYQVSRDAPLHPDQIEALDEDRQWLIFADEADSLVNDLWACAERLHNIGRRNIVFLIAARDTDWRQSGGEQKGWASRLSRLDDLVVGGIAEEDAALVVKAWEQHGEAGLRRLGAVETSEARVQRLVAATKAQEVDGSDGSFFGGLLDTRFSAAGLVEHVVELMTPLRAREIAGGTGTLYDALIYIANCHAVGMPGIDKRVLAALCGVEKHLVSSVVRAPLGKEIGAADSGGHILTRHKKVAEAVVVASETRFDTDLIDVWERLVRETVRLGRDGQVSRECHGPIVHAGARLKRDLPDGLTARRRGFIGIVVAEVAMEAMPEWSSTIVDRARALRFAAQGMEKSEARKLLQEGCDLMKSSLGLLNKAIYKADKF